MPDQPVEESEVPAPDNGANSDEPTSAPRRRAFPAKRYSIIAVLLLGALIFLAWSSEWGSLALNDSAHLTVSGAVASPALAALGLASLALGAALTLAGVLIRFLLAGLTVLLGVSVAIAGFLPATDFVSASAAVVTEHSGVAGSESVRALVSSAQSNAWPWITVLLGVLLVAAGVLIATTATSWAGSTRKYQAVRFANEDGTPVSNWDSLSHGDDPTHEPGPAR